MVIELDVDTHLSPMLHFKMLKKRIARLVATSVRILLHRFGRRLILVSAEVLAIQDKNWRTARNTLTKDAKQR